MNTKELNANYVVKEKENMENHTLEYKVLLNNIDWKTEV